MTGIDRKRVRNSFHVHAHDYDRHAMVQKRVLVRFIGLLPGGDEAISRVLDIGAGTGALLQELSHRYPSASLYGLDLAYGMGLAARERMAGNGRVAFLTADAEELPYAAASLDLVVSTSTFQWLETFEQAFGEIRRVLRPGGRFCFALFGEKTLHELRTAYKTAARGVSDGTDDRTHRFKSVDDVAVALRVVGLEPAYLASEFEVELHPDVAHLLRSIRRIGAGNAVKASGRGLAERRIMLEMMEIYQREYGSGETIPATYEVIYGVVRKSSG
ncbi:MAG: methyltransferase domain-containing protein [Geobacter sp.]|nr:methyltransferase domain-containing protein [Geobacter sp.]